MKLSLQAFPKTHSSSADGPFFIEYDRTIGVKVSHLICKLCLRSMLWGTHRACLDRITALELKPPANTMRQIPSHAACGQILSFTNPYLTLTVPWSKVSLQFLSILSMIPVTWLILTCSMCVESVGVKMNLMAYGKQRWQTESMDCMSHTCSWPTVKHKALTDSERLRQRQR